MKDDDEFQIEIRVRSSIGGDVIVEETQKAFALRVILCKVTYSHWINYTNNFEARRCSAEGFPNSGD